MTRYFEDFQSRDIQALKVKLGGRVQGVGFRPFVQRLAGSMSLRGSVRNCAEGVEVCVEGSSADIEEFLSRLARECPPPAELRKIRSERISCLNYLDFRIAESDALNSVVDCQIPFDLSCCESCRAELFDPGNRRSGYAFISCSQCGPRYSLIEQMPYDRSKTSMADFQMCSACLAEYLDPQDKRFHSQTNCCSQCGPELRLYDSQAREMQNRTGIIEQAVELLCEGEILAIKGVGGFILLADAQNDLVLAELRRRKRRPVKPFALMYPDLAMIERDCLVSRQEANILRSAPAPIVLLERHSCAGVSTLVAPDSYRLGVMLPPAALFDLILSRYDSPLVATSANVHSEPICIDNAEAFERLNGIADYFLCHERRILRPLDDAIVQVIANKPQLLRPGRGYAPLEFSCHDLKTLQNPQIFRSHNMLALGANQKSTIALATASCITVSQQLGDLNELLSMNNFERTAQNLTELKGIQPEYFVSDMHPDYVSSIFARQQAAQCLSVQHHQAHAFACLFDNQLVPPALAVVWDGAGYGDDGSIWGGEFFTLDDRGAKRVAHLATMQLPAGESALRDCRRVAVSALYQLGFSVKQVSEALPAKQFCSQDLKNIFIQLERRLNTHRSSSIGRLFDAVAGLLGLCAQQSFEAEAAMVLEALAYQGLRSEVAQAAYPINLRQDGQLSVLDWQDLIAALLEEFKTCQPLSLLSARFHRALAKGIRLVAERYQIENILLSGGCFQSKVLSELVISELRLAGFKPFWHAAIPANDAGICVGQIVATNWQWINHMTQESPCA